MNPVRKAMLSLAVLFVGGSSLAFFNPSRAAADPPVTIPTTVVVSQGGTVVGALPPGAVSVTSTTYASITINGNTYVTSLTLTPDGVVTGVLPANLVSGPTPVTVPITVP